jgi:hypothetical protein
VNRRYVLIGVEGNHDQAFLEKILRKLLGFTKWDEKSELDPLWRSKFVPTYPTKTGKYYARLDMPSILHKDDLSIAIYVGEGSNLLPNLILKLSNLDTAVFSAFAIVADADNKTPNEISKYYCDGFKEYFPNFPNQAGAMIKGSPNLGIYILPNNSDLGVLDTLLCECGEVAYPVHMQRAKDYINQFSEIKWKRFDKDKATIATVVSVLKPGKTNTTSIADNEWISDNTAKQISSVKSLVKFLNALIGITEVTS